MLDPLADAQDMIACYGNIIEALFDLKVVRMARKGDEAAQGSSWRVTRALTGMRRDVTTKTGVRLSYWGRMTVDWAASPTAPREQPS